MNIVSIMTDLIERQKISKRHSHGSTAGSGCSLIAAAGRFRYAEHNKNNKRLSGRAGGLYSKVKKRLKPVAKRKKSPKISSGQRVARRPAVPGNLMSLLNSIQKRFAGVNRMMLISTAAVLVIAPVFAYYINIYVDNLTMFESFALNEDVNINDVLYESLPSDYDGQGSGEIAGIEPVLLTAGEPVNYTVKLGDTLSEISKDNNIKIGTLISFNKITDVRRLQVGTELMIPQYDGIPYEIKSGDSLSSISKKHNISVNSILDANNLDSDVLKPGEILYIPGAAMNEFDYKKAMGTLFIYPTRGRLSSGFGYRPDPFTGKIRFHNGLDLANALGTRVAATMSGIIADVGDRPSGYGKYVIVKHPNGYQSLYGHLSRVTVREGQYISQGEKLGEMGNTGRSTGPHLHFSIYKNNSPVNPANYLW